MTTQSHTQLPRILALLLAFALGLCPSINTARAQCDPNWTPLGSGTDGQVNALQVFDDGSGPALFVGGVFNLAGNTAALNIAKWNGSDWFALGSGTSIGTGSTVYAMATFDDGSGEALYVGGTFLVAGGRMAQRIAKWDGSTWSPLGEGLFGQNAVVKAIAVFDDGNGPALYAGGLFESAGTTGTAHNIARWDGTDWTTVGGGVTGGLFPSVWAMGVYDDGNGEALYVGGDFDSAGTLPANNIARWDGTSWSALGTGTAGTVESRVMAITQGDDGTGRKLHVGGDFRLAGGVSVNNIAAWDGTRWTSTGAGFNNNVYDIFSYDDGTGSALYAAGDFGLSAAVPMRSVARWDGSLWHAVKSGVQGPCHAIDALNISGTSLFIAGGRFLYAGSIPAHNIASITSPKPSITRHPIDRTVEEGHEVLFWIAANSSMGPMTIRWRKDGVPLAEQPPRITGTQTLSLRIDPVTKADEGRYDVVVSNICGSTTSTSASLTVTYKPCYPDCDQSTGPRVLDIFDFLCFQSAFVTLDPYADCDGNNVLNIFDFLCFQDAFVSGCP